MAAGGVTKTNKLGFVYAFPISQTIANIDAFQLGAQKVNPAAQTYLVNTSNWCDPLKQKEAAAALLAQDMFTGGPYNANWVGTFAHNDNPLTLASFGSSVPANLKAKITAEQAALKQPGASVFTGPISCQDGTVLVPAGQTMTYDQVNNIRCLVRGVVGSLPKS